MIETSTSRVESKESLSHPPSMKGESKGNQSESKGNQSESKGNLSKSKASKTFAAKRLKRHNVGGGVGGSGGRSAGTK